MAKSRNNSIVIILLALIICVQCSLATKFQPNFVHFDQIKHDLHSMRDFNFSNLISEISLQKNWRENRECLMELTAIKHGFDVFDEWAVKRKAYSNSFETKFLNEFYLRILVADSWGKFPSGVMGGNFFEFGSFPQCFRIERNGERYETQYCIAQLKFHSNEQSETNTLMPRLDVGPSISIGVCLPAVCSIDHLESLVNKIIQKKASNMTLNIPRRSCQFEENATDLNTLDYSAM